MRLLEVRAVAFGPFEDRSLELSPGLNLIVGPNEAGKSTWHAALFAGLCGVRRTRGGQKIEDREFGLRHRPWTSEAWSVLVRLELDDGRRLELRQDLTGESESTVTDLVTGRPATAELLHEGAPDGALLLGLTRRTLGSTLAVRQAEILQVLESPDELQGQLQRAASTGGADDTVQTALETIKGFRLERVGPQRKGSQRPLMVAREALPMRQEELERAVREHADYLELKDRQLDARRRADDLEGELAVVLGAIDRREVKTLKERVERARVLAARFPEGTPPDPEAVGAEVSEAAIVLRDFTSRPEIPELPPGRSVAEIESRLAELPAAPTGEREPAEQVVELRQAANTARRLREAQQGAELQTGRKPQTGGAAAPELRRLAAALEEPGSELDHELEHRVAELRLAVRRSARAGRTQAMFGFGAAVALGGVALLVLDQKGFGLGAVFVGALLLALGWRALSRKPPRLEELPALEARLEMQREAATRSEADRRDAATRASELGLMAESATLRRLAGELETCEVMARERESWQRRLDRLVQEEEEAAAKLRSVLTARLEKRPREDESPGSLWERYRSECRQRAAQAEAAERRPALERELESRRALEAAATADLAARATAERQLVDLARRVDIDAEEDPDRLVEQLESWREEREGARRRMLADREAWVQLQEILAGSRMSDLEAELERSASGLSSVAEPVPTPEDGDDLEATRRSLEQRLLEVASERDRLAGQVKDRARHLASVAEAEEALNHAESELSRVEELDATLARTLEYLERARDKVQRDIAPRIAGAIGHRLAAVTGGRYEEVAVDPANLEVRVRATDGRWREARQLSHGTAEQVYLLLRVALAELLVTTGETAPLLLDDVTVQSDAGRTRAILELLHELSGERQVVLFSQEDEVVAWANEALDSARDRLIDLESAANPAG